jgi:hypothetical protein
LVHRYQKSLPEHEHHHHHHDEEDLH